MQGKIFIRYKDFIKKIEEYFAPREVEVEFCEDKCGINFIKVKNEDSTFEAFAYYTKPSCSNVLQEIFPLGEQGEVDDANISECNFVSLQQYDEKKEELSQKYKLSDKPPSQWADKAADDKQCAAAHQEWLDWIDENEAVELLLKKDSSDHESKTKTVS